MPSVGVLVVHGMGSQPPTFAEELRHHLVEEIGKLGEDTDDIAWGSGYWAKELECREDQLWNDLALDKLDWHRLRRFVVAALGDAVAYRPSGEQHLGIYVTVHKAIRDSLRVLRRELGDMDKPLVVVAHSLGSHVMSNYVWDAEQGHDVIGDPSEWTPFERGETMTLFVTFGSNIPLFTLAYDRVQPITFPPRNLPDKMRACAKWLNFLDVDDVLAYPLKGLSKEYAEAVSEDIRINVGPIGEAGTPLSHGAYWNDRSFVKPVARAICDVLIAARRGI